VICSLNEIGSTLRKAAVGSGYPVGLAADIAAAGVWLCARDLDGVDAVLSSIGSGFESDTDWEPDGMFLQVGDASIGRSGTSFLELLVAKEIDRVVVERADSPLLLVGLAGVVAGASETRVELSVGSGLTVVVSPRTVHSTEGVVGIESGPINIVEIDERGNGEATEPLPTIHGVEVSEQQLAVAMELAARTYVPATEVSRMSGAGAGLSDND
jgi:hypothetical protein